MGLRPVFARRRFAEHDPGLRLGMVFCLLGVLVVETFGGIRGMGLPAGVRSPVGCRTGRRAPLGRRVVTRGCRLAVRALFGAAIRDVNTPYRLMRRSWLQLVLPRIPGDAFAPNVILTGLAGRGGLRIYEHAVPYHARKTGTGSLVALKLWRAAFRSLVETVWVALGGAPKGSR